MEAVSSVLKLEVSRAVSQEEKTAVKRGKQDKLEPARITGIYKDEPEPTSVPHHH